MSDFDETFDVVVVGSGGGAMTAALAAKAKGLRPVILEKSPFYGGTTSMSGGAIWIPCNGPMLKAGVKDSRDEAMTYLKTITKGEVADDLLEAYVDFAPRMVDFLIDDLQIPMIALTKYPDYYPDAPGGKPGGRSMEAEPFDGSELGAELARLRPAHPQERAFGKIAFTAAEAHRILFTGVAGQLVATWHILRYMFQTFKRLPYDRDLRLTLGNALAGRLRHAVMRKDIEVRLHTAVTDVIVEDGRVVGVVAETDGGVRRIGASKGVVLGAGGFAHNARLRQMHNPKPITTNWTAASRADTGDMHTLAEKYGWQTKYHGAWWTPTTVVPGQEIPWLLVIEKALPGSIIVNQHGKRFTNEAAPYLDVVEGMYADQEKSGATVPSYLIMDRTCRLRYPCGPVLPGLFQPEFLWKSHWKNDWLYKDATLDGLAAKLSIDGAVLADTVKNFNENAKQGVDPDFDRGKSLYDRYYADPRVKPNPSLGPIKKAPYYAIPVWPGDLGTKGGLVIDAKARVLDADGAPVPGLYAIGNSTASVMGPTYPGAGGTIGPSMTFGFIAAGEMAGE
ncbi:MAG: FAD-dependent oxidoreductase [Deltaproteobacteria bacterium]|nr:FAD-dependent oxidoreductase [Deltaproteobacteria bacterium]